MPTYICRAPTGLLSPNSKLELASAITAIHSQVTGGGTRFTQVLFRDIAMSDCFIGGKPLEGPHCFIQGHIRAGRSAIERADLIRKIVPAACDILGVPRYAVWILLSELPSRAMAEFGHILPEPGDEDTWLENLPAEDRKRLQLI
jgi:phenylpyruvate tautomerase PptA (4-oxalocrotonate tautomerase family)